MADETRAFRQIFWTSVILGLSIVVIGNLLRMVDRNLINQAAYEKAGSFLKTYQPDYFPLLFLLIGFIVAFAIVWVYGMICSKLPQNWIARGLLVGGFIFVIGDFPTAILSGYTTMLPALAVQGTALTGLVNWLINGCILTYTYNRLSPEWQKSVN
jgi:hypothetical protein